MKGNKKPPREAPIPVRIHSSLLSKIDSRAKKNKLSRHGMIISVLEYYFETSNFTDTQIKIRK